MLRKLEDTTVIRESIVPFAMLAANALVLLAPLKAYAGDGATLVLREGQVVRTKFGFKDISEAYKRMGSNQGNRILALTMEGGTFLINLAEVAIVCRDDCPALTVEDPRRTKAD